jgi:hypothetical protein
MNCPPVEISDGRQISRFVRKKPIHELFLNLVGIQAQHECHRPNLVNGNRQCCSLSGSRKTFVQHQARLFIENLIKSCPAIVGKYRMTGAVKPPIVLSAKLKIDVKSPTHRQMNVM